MFKKLLQGILLLGGCATGSVVSAATVTLVANGADNSVDADFWQLSYSAVAGDPVSVSSVTIDVSPVAASVHFDFDGDGTFACNPDCFNFSTMTFDTSGEGPVFNTGSGVTGADVAFGWTGDSPGSIDIALTGFGNGDSFTFGANTNGLNGIQETGFDSGDLLAGAMFTVLFSDGSSANGVLDTACGVNCTLGTATLAAVPVPAAAWLFGSGLLGLAGVARRRKR